MLKIKITEWDRLQRHGIPVLPTACLRDITVYSFFNYSYKYTGRKHYFFNHNHHWWYKTVLRRTVYKKVTPFTFRCVKAFFRVPLLCSVIHWHQTWNDALHGFWNPLKMNWKVGFWITFMSSWFLPGIGSPSVYVLLLLVNE